MLEKVAPIKAGCTPVVFGDMVRKVSDKVDPWESGLERYVAGEHLDTDDLQIRRWGLIGDNYLGPAFHMRFKPGQVLYGSRRTYLRKVALADFEGITANTTYVLETKNPTVLMPELLPFIMQTEAFHAHSIARSKGSVNPYINFSDIACFQFLLPPIEMQRRIVNVLEAARCSTNAMAEVFYASGVLSRALSLRAFSPCEIHGIRPTDWKPDSWDVTPLEALVEADAPICYGIVQVRDFDANGVPTLAINDLGGDFCTGVHRTSDSIERTFARSRVKSGDVVISIKGTIGESAIVPENFQGNISRDLARLRFTTERINPRYFLHLYQSPAFKRYTTSLVVGTTRAELSIDTIRRMEIPFPTPDLQCAIADEMDQANLSVTNSRKRLTEAKGMMRCLAEGFLHCEETQ